MKNSDLIVGNSSAALMEAPIYGIPAINIGNRQKNRFFHVSIKNVPFNQKEIVSAIKNMQTKKYKFTKHFGKGNSSILISNILKQKKYGKFQNKNKWLYKIFNE